MPRKQYRVQITGDQREDIDPDQIAQILLDLILQESDTEQTGRIERPQSGTRVSKHVEAAP